LQSLADYVLAKIKRAAALPPKMKAKPSGDQKSKGRSVARSISGVSRGTINQRQ
jgi:hypothetical protein